jgi:simple sugar transport system ATP-binding protein
MTSIDRQQTATLELAGVSKHFDGVVALEDVSISLSEREIVAIVGDNGAGKSTLLKILAGVHQPSGGEVRVNGEAQHFSEPRDSKAQGIEVVYQDLALVDRQPVYMNMFLGREITRTALKMLDRKRMRQETADILEELDVHVPSSGVEIRKLSGGQRQGVAIGRAVHWARQVILMDEPTAALGIQETARVEKTIARMRERGLSILLVSHNLDQVFRLADRIYVLRRGRLAGEVKVADTDADEVVSLITGLEHEQVGESAPEPDGG